MATIEVAQRRERSMGQMCTVALVEPLRAEQPMRVQQVRRGYSEIQVVLIDNQSKIAIIYLCIAANHNVRKNQQSQCSRLPEEMHVVSNG